MSFSSRRKRMTHARHMHSVSHQGSSLPFTLILMLANPNTAKRTRTDESGSEELTYTSSSSPTPKAQRLSGKASSSTEHSSPLLCTLPPTCHPPHNRPAVLQDTQELESHYAKYHAFVCEEDHCGAVFPGSRLLELVRSRSCGYG